MFGRTTLFRVRGCRPVWGRGVCGLGSQHAESARCYSGYFLDKNRGWRGGLADPVSDGRTERSVVVVFVVCWSTAEHTAGTGGAEGGRGRRAYLFIVGVRRGTLPRGRRGISPEL